jgi:hypothetical protein
MKLFEHREFEQAIVPGADQEQSKRKTLTAMLQNTNVY